MVGYDPDEYDPPPPGRSRASPGLGAHAVTLIIFASGVALLWPTCQAEPRRAELRTVAGVLAAPVQVSTPGRHDFFDTSAILSIQADASRAGGPFAAELKDLRKLWRIIGPSEGLAGVAPGTRLRVGVVGGDDRPIIMELALDERVLVTFEQALAAERESRRNARWLGIGVVALGIGVAAWPLVQNRRRAIAA